MIRLIVGMLAVCLASSGLAEESTHKPNFSGVWQVLNTANYNIEAHMAEASMQLREGPFGPLPIAELVPLGAVAAVSSGNGVVEGGPLPYQDWAREQRDENRANWLDRDPEVKCYPAGRTARDLHALSVSDTARRQGNSDCPRVRRGRAQYWI